MATHDVDNNVPINESKYKKNNMILAKSKSDSCVKYTDHRIKRIIEQNTYTEDTYPSQNKQHQTKKPNKDINKIYNKEPNDYSLCKSVSCKY